MERHRAGVALVAEMNLGGMGPLVARALDPRRMTLAKKDVAGYGDIAILFFEWWAHLHEFLLRGQQRGETVEEYFQAKQELLGEGDTYGDMMATYPAYWRRCATRRREMLCEKNPGLPSSK